MRWCRCRGGGGGGSGGGGGARTRMTKGWRMRIITERSVRTPCT
eukprot:COSAG01_NODE_21035_length_921_cov_2.425791_1_plen_43_part_10